MKIINILIILIAGMMFACNDNVYEDFDNGMIIRCKELRNSDDKTSAQPWLYKYNIRDYSSTAGNTPGFAGDFYLYSSSNFAVGDTVTFTTTANLKNIDSLQKGLDIAAENLTNELQKTKILHEKNIKLQAELSTVLTKNKKLIKFKNDLKKLATL